MKHVDLHTHSKSSDGMLTPRELVFEAKRIGLHAISLTDHDTVDGLDEALTASEECGIHFIPGVELSVDHEKGSLHLLGYGINHKDPILVSTLRQLSDSRENRNIKIVAKLGQLGYPITYESVKKHSKEGTLGRGHIALALIEAGYVSSVEEAFGRLLTKDGPAYIDRYRLSIYDAIDMIHSVGGAAVWAHPGLHEERLPEMLEQLPDWVKGGLDGLETDYSQHSEKQCRELQRVAHRFGLICTGGSDFHGEIKPGINLGNGPGKSLISIDHFDQLNLRLEAIREEVVHN